MIYNVPATAHLPKKAPSIIDRCTLRGEIALGVEDGEKSLLPALKPIIQGDFEH